MTITIVDEELISGPEVACILVLPFSGEGRRRGAYSSTAVSFAKALRASDIEVDFQNKPEYLLDQRGADWFGPVLLICSSIYSSNPEIFNKIVEVLMRHLSNLYPSVADPEVRLTVKIQKTKERKITQVTFEGSSTGLKMLSDKLNEICRD